MANLEQSRHVARNETDHSNVLAYSALSHNPSTIRSATISPWNIANLTSAVVSLLSPKRSFHLLVTGRTRPSTPAVWHANTGTTHDPTFWLNRETAFFAKSGHPTRSMWDRAGLPPIADQRHRQAQWKGCQYAETPRPALGRGALRCLHLSRRPGTSEGEAVDHSAAAGRAAAHGGASDEAAVTAVTAVTGEATG